MEDGKLETTVQIKEGGLKSKPDRIGWSRFRFRVE